MSDLPKSVLYRAKEAVRAAILDVTAWADMADRVFVGLANSEIEEPLVVRVTASNFAPNNSGTVTRGWLGQVDIAVWSQGDDTTPEEHAEWCERIEAFVTQAPGDIETRIDDADKGVTLRGASPSPAQDANVDGLMVTRYGISGLWTLAMEEEEA